jgi:hypothetical protein
MANSHSKLASLIGQGFQTRNYAHLFHLTTDSYAAHAALNQYYDGIIDLLDGIAETYQGFHGVVPQAIYVRGLQYDVPSGAIEMLKAYQTWIKSNRMAVCDSSVIQNQIDTVVELIASTLYKLENLS